ncbi:serine/threonine-protein kinase [Actinomadura sp. NAK00032]|uniref:serine/threonine-protein kinase n=1 Tax=Actinomadura sp. NAK00032 TaxID=2742128 RepID=UPI001C37DCC6|nr:serine/threonine-protein kinase [Actinomadura sp. NAK00032]
MPAAGALRPGDPERLGRYRLTGRLGEGGQGTVFLAEDEGGGHGRVAVKLLHGRLGDDPEARARFLRELDTAKRVAEFCTAAILDADAAGDRPYIVSEFVDGPSLHRVVTTEGPRTRGALERLAVGTATALVAIHRAGVVHRDFKPHNVLLGSDGPRVIDFGIARALDGATITVSGAIGTPAFMAPEQLEGLRAGEAPPTAAGPSASATATQSPASSGSSTAESRRTGIPDRYAGTWTGRVTQNDGKVFPMTLVLPAGGAAGRVAYPLQNCSGTETYLRRTGDTLVFLERITSGTERCVDTGSVSLTPETGGDRLVFRYSGTSPNGRHWTVTGPLSRS